MKTGQDKDAESTIQLTSVNGLRFVGRYGGYTDDDTRLTYFWHRWYDSSDGRWVSRDPIGVAGGVNLYGYVLNQPLFFVDADGLCPGGEEYESLPIPQRPKKPTETKTREKDLCIRKPYPTPSPEPCILKGGLLLGVTIRCAGAKSFITVCVVYCNWSNGDRIGYLTFLRPLEKQAKEKCERMGPICRY